MSSALQALEALRVQPEAQLQAALLGCTVHASMNMTDDGVADTLRALLKLNAQRDQASHVALALALYSCALQKGCTRPQAP